MAIIGITGGVGTGKSTVAKMFVRLGAKGLDADKIVHQEMAPRGRCYARLVKTFGPGILRGQRIDRKKLAQLIFTDPSQRRKAERIIHPVVKQVVREEIRKHKTGRWRDKNIVIEVPLLFESKMDRLMDLNIVVQAKRSIQIFRAMTKLSITRAQALRRIHAQMPMKQKVCLADIIINNDGPLAHTRKQVKEIWKKIK